MDKNMDKNKVKYDDKYFKKKHKRWRKWENQVGHSIVEMFSLKSILDLGCGVGSYLEGSFLAGCKDIIGLELNYDIAKKYIAKNISSYIKYGDITKPLNLQRKFDCVLSVEVAEHIDYKIISGFIDNLQKYPSKYIIFTAAPPGQLGRGHINLRKKNLWIKDIESNDTMYRDDIVKKCIKEWKKFDVPDYIFKNLIIFEKV